MKGEGKEDWKEGKETGRKSNRKKKGWKREGEYRMKSGLDGKEIKKRCNNKDSKDEKKHWNKENWRKN